jgi:plastocyanin
MDTRFARWVGGAVVLGLMMIGCDGGGGTTTPQPQTGTVSGTVMSQGAGVSGVQVALTGKGTQTTNSSGAFTFTQVTAGTHSIAITLPEDLELDGTETLQKSVTVTAGQTATVSWALKPAGPTTITTETVNMGASSFQPATVTVKAGSTIRWVNGSAILHTITPDGHTAWNRVETSATGEVLRVTLNNAGEYEYHCEIHAGMNGEIVVQP